MVQRYRLRLVVCPRSKTTIKVLTWYYGNVEMKSAVDISPGVMPIKMIATTRSVLP